MAAAAMAQAFHDAADHVDDKWSQVMDQADRVRQAVAARIGGRPEDVALAASTHELVARFLSALPWSAGATSSPPTASSTAWTASFGAWQRRGSR
ncbi:MAG: hypothetical protein R3F43_16430 [bacterium]